MDNPTHLRAISQLSIDFIASALSELTIQTRLSPTDLLILLNIIAANGAHLYDHTISDADAMAHKRPISILALSEYVGLPRETCRRRVVQLVKAGLVERQASGLVATVELLAPERVAALAPLGVRLVRRLVSRLRLQGVTV